MKFAVLFLALFFTIAFLNHRFSSAIAAIAFNQGEEKGGAIVSIALTFLVALLWAIYITCF